LLNQLIDAIRQFQSITVGATSPSGGSSSLANKTFITEINETVSLPNSRRLNAGTGITFDLSVPGVLTLNVSIVEKEWDVLTDGDEINPEIIFAGGQVIMVHVP
jgi:hypothetical protein